MGQQEVYEVLKASKKWLFSREILDRLKVKINTGSLSRNLSRLRQSGLVKSKFVERNKFKYMAI